jgi:hypothetical protein
MHAPTFHSACGWEHLSVWAQRAKAAGKKTRLEFTGYLFDDSVIIGLSSRSVDALGVELRYSIGADSNPCCMTNSVKYRQPFCLNTLGTTVIKAVCLQKVTGCQSEVVEAAFTVTDQPVEPPMITNPGNGSKHTKEVVVSMSLDPNRANYQATNIHYTTDGSAPTALSSAWVGTGLVVHAPGSHTLRAIAARKRNGGAPGFKMSEEVCVTFELCMPICRLPDEIGAHARSHGSVNKYIHTYAQFAFYPPLMCWLSLSLSLSLRLCRLPVPQ